MRFFPTLLTVLSLSLLPVFAACDDDEKSMADTTSDTTADTTSPDTSVPDATEPDTNVPDTNLPDTGTPDTGTPDTGSPDTSEPVKVEAACSEGGYSDCFINADCEASERCQNMSANDVEIPCCITGARGTKVAGEACTSENECDTSLCISYNDGPQLCSMPCPEDGSDCPPAASACVFGLCVPPTP